MYCSEYGGLLLRYLQAGKLALIKGDLLFVHGAVREASIGYCILILHETLTRNFYLCHHELRKVPPCNNASGVKEWTQYSSLVEWVDALNVWAAAQVTNYLWDIQLPVNALKHLLAGAGCRLY